MFRHFTQGVVDDLKFDDPTLKAKNNNVWVWDRDRSAGLGVKLHRGKRSISKKFVVSFSFKGVDRRDVLGDVCKNFTLAKAQLKALQFREAAANGIDPKPDRKLKNKKVATVVAQTVVPQAVANDDDDVFINFAVKFLGEKHGKIADGTSYRNLKRYLTGPHIAPFEKLRLNQITQRAIVTQLEFLRDVGAPYPGRAPKPSPDNAKEVYKALNQLFKRAKHAGLVESNPLADIEMKLIVDEDDQERDGRPLEDDEIVAVWNETGDGSHYSKIVRLDLFLGTRRSESGGMHKDEIKDGNWILTRTKNGHPVVLPLPEAVLNITRSVEPRDDGLLFGKRSPEGFTGWDPAKKALDARLNIKPWRLHDLRHTLITGMTKLGIPDKVRKAITNHAEGKEGKEGKKADVHNRVYNHVAEIEQQLLDKDMMAAKRDALQRWSEHVLDLVERSSNVPLKEAA